VNYKEHQSAVDAIEEMHNKPFINGEILIVEHSSM
jgi:hypothetical protein